MNRLAIIGGTGVYTPDMLSDVRELQVSTPYGNMNCMLGTHGAKEVIFMTRHGNDHSIPPHRINYRANIYGLKKLGVKAIVATTAVGSLNPDMKPGEMVLCNQFLDFTKSRAHTFYDGAPLPVAHVDMTDPYCPVLRSLIQSEAQKLGLKMHPQGTYVCTEGPRFESAAEIRMFAQLGADVVGMTNVPECPLAREAEIAYATISMVTNFGAGISPTILTHQEVLDAMQNNKDNFRRLVEAIIESFDPEMDSPALHAMSEYGGFQVEAETD